MEHRVYSVPYTLREQFVLTDNFAACLKQWGWRLSEHRPIYTDPQVIRQRYLLASSGRTYTDRTFYHLFREWNFRALLRVLLATHHTTKEALLAICPDGEKLSSYLTFLHDQDMLLHTKHAYARGPALAGIHDIGHTLEWWSAEWLRRSFASQGLLPVRHGVTLTGMIRGGDTGDLDVVAFPGNAPMIMECKSSLLQVDSITLNLFLWRASLLEPDLALLLIDASPSQCKQVLAKVQRRLASWQIPPVEGLDEQGIHWNAGNPVIATGPAGQSVHWDTGNIYAALSTEQNSLERVLETVLHHYQMHHA